jgi:hypothetical protein
LCGIEAETNKQVQGVDLTGVLCSGETHPERSLFTVAAGRNRSGVRKGEYRYHDNAELYNVIEDIAETADLAGEKPERAAAMKAELDAMFAQFPPIAANAVIPVGFKEWPTTYLQTQDAILSGEVKRSSIHPNCSWVCDWKDLDASLLWHIEVETSGTYKLGVMYSAHAGQLGSRFVAECFGKRTTNGHEYTPIGKKNDGDASSPQSGEIRSPGDGIGGTSKCEFSITEEFNHPELHGFDRYPRDESYEKEFTIFECGTMTLSRGEVEFILRALEMPGDDMPHIRALKLELQV